jgi:hypothetical protein
MEWLLYILLAIILVAVVAGLILGVPSLLRYMRMRKM